MIERRHLEWEGCFNVRDLGGIAVSGGGSVRAGALARSDNPERLTAAGWRALVEHGVRTVVDLQLRAAGLTDGDVAELRARLVQVPTT
ncbi:tyrosine-protein phosphatase [Nonomuraea sp. NPDC004580]|uniref:tyrosine-protein phosphatase n=1 Tax=Nonomuraea sp. NPDC004580 TaxID=3154552 RepID=UPI0033A42E61